MRANGFNVGGEQSGHIVLSDYNTTATGYCSYRGTIALEDTGNSQEGTQALFSIPSNPVKTLGLGNSPLDNKTVKEAVDDGISLEAAVILVRVRREPLIRVMAEGTDQALFRVSSLILSRLSNKSN